MNERKDTLPAVVIQPEGDYDIATALSQLGPDAGAYLVDIHKTVTNAKFKQYRFEKKLSVSIRFAEVENCEKSFQVTQRAKQLMGYDFELVNLTFRSVIQLMKQQDEMITTITGKNIIIPMSAQTQTGDKATYIVFKAVSKTEPRWKLQEWEKKKVTGKNGVVPIVERM